MAVINPFDYDHFLRISHRLEKYFIFEGCLEFKSLKLKSVLKSTGKLRVLEIYYLLLMET